MSKIKVSLIDNNLVSGSCEKLRSETKNDYFFSDSDYGGVYEHRGAGGLVEDSYLSDIKSNYDLVITTHDSALLKSHTFPVRLFGNNSKIESDDQWNKIIYGGIASEQSYVALFETDSTYSDNLFTFSSPYGNFTAKSLTAIDSTDYEAVKILPVYNYSLNKFEQKTTFSSEYTQPNIYFFQTINDIEQAGQTPEYYHAIVQDSILFSDSISDYMPAPIATVSELLSATEMSETNGSLPPEESLYYGNYDTDSSLTSDTFFDRNYNLRNYLSSAYVALAPYQANVNFINPLPLGTISENIVFDHDLAKTYLDSNSEVLSTADLFPYYVKIEIPNYDTDTEISDLLADSDPSDRLFFMEALARIFNAAENFTNMSSLNYYSTRMYNNASEGSVNYIEQTDISSLNYIDLINVFSSHLAGGSSVFGTQIYFPGTQDVHKFLASNQLQDLSITARESSITRILLNLVNYLNNSSRYDLSSYAGEDVYNKILNFNADSKYSETIAYKVVKKNSRGVPISNFWVYNNNDIELLNFVDSQVILNNKYTYEVYQYKIVNGYRYGYTDGRISTTISSELDSDGEATVLHVLEFKDNSNNTADQLFQTEEDNSYAATNPFATNAQVLIDTESGDSQYLFDFLFTFTPTLKIVEIPIYSKTLVVRDHPSTSIDVIPYQVLDDSQKIGFHLIKEAYHKRNLPMGLDQLSANAIQHYKSSNDLIESEKISIKSRKKTLAVHVYRLLYKPTKYLDFANNLHKSISMINDEEQLSRVICESTIETNTKYYYAFQFINEGGMPGEISEIYEVELVDDGGYKYAIFNTLHESDLGENTINKSSIDFKKLIQLVPNTSQMKLVTDNADFSEHSYTQLDNVNVGLDDLVDPIWGKTFKLRLTSKKTGKKIDLNITYNLENG